MSSNVLPLSVKFLTTWSAMTRFLLVAVVLAWVVLVLAWGALHWLIVPRINEWRPQLEQQATRTLGVTVQVGSVVAVSNGWIPSFEMKDVRLLDSKGRLALSLPRIVAALSPQSLWRLGFEQIYIDRPMLEVRRAKNGQINIGGLSFHGSDDTALLDWLFSQRELVIRDGTLRWSDEQRSAEPVALRTVNVVLRNKGRHHDMRVDATPPAVWGQGFSVMAKFLQPLLAQHSGRWQDWQGQIYATLAQVDVFALRRYVDVDVGVRQGMGALRTWVDVNQGSVTQAVTDVALVQVSVALSPSLQPLMLARVHGRVGGRVLGSDLEFFSKSLVFDTQEGQHWPGGNITVKLLGAYAAASTGGSIVADRLDLDALAQIARHLPVDARLRESLLAYAPKGLIDSLQVHWQGSLAAPQTYSAKGSVRALTVATVASTPGLQGADVSFDFDQNAGQADIAITSGSVVLPTFFQEPVLVVNQLHAMARWQVEGEHIAVQIDNMTFANADAQGQARIRWETSDPLRSSDHSRFPGVLDLQASLSRADGKQVYRYLPLVVNRLARDYVRDAVQDGKSDDVQFVMKGDISQFPRIAPQKGIFKITAQVRDAQFAYVPQRLQMPGELPWPSLRKLNGELVIDGMQLHVKNASATLGQSLKVTAAHADVADLADPLVKVSADVKGLAAELLKLINSSPIAAMTGQALQRTVVSGDTTNQLQLTLPLADLLKTSVQGSVTCNGNDVQITPDSPKLTRVRGQLHFTENGLSVSQVRARLLGGDARLEGGLRLSQQALPKSTVPSVIRVFGVATAEGLRQASELGLVSRLANLASGAATYSATLGMRRGVPELQMNSSLQGLALNLPHPLGKSADTSVSLQLKTSVLTDAPDALHQRLSMSVADVLRVWYERDLSAPTPRVLRGAMELGLQAHEFAPQPASGVSANFRFGSIDVDAWRDVLTQVSGAELGNSADYLPSVLALRSDIVIFASKPFRQVVLGGSRDGVIWRANLKADEVNGYLEYQQPSDQTGNTNAGRVYARLARLSIAPNMASDVEALLDEQPASIPALDIDVNDFEWRGKHLGHLQVQAINRAKQNSPGATTQREWRLSKFNLTLPEARFAATGDWVALQNSADKPLGKDKRRTALGFTLDIADSGALLHRFGMKDVVSGGKGQLQGQVGWIGSPMSPDYKSMSGTVSVNVASGQFLKADPGIAKLLGVLSLQSLPRRLTLDFRDVFSQGFAFDFVRGNVTLNKGIASTNNLQMKGVNAAVLMEGSADVERETQDLKVVVIPEINAGTASLLASVVNPAVGLGTFLAQVFLRRPLIESATQEFHVSGSWTDPTVIKVVKPVEKP